MWRRVAVVVSARPITDSSCSLDMSTAAASLTSLVVAVVVMTSLMVVAQNSSGSSCKSPYVEARLLSDDARAASPFYVLALPRTAQSSRIDSICYTYFDPRPQPSPQSPFFHLMSVTNSDGSNAVHEFTKGDIAGRPGLAVATGLSGSECVFHDYTLKPICDSTVFILYRCFIQGECASGVAVDAGRVPGVDVRLALSATPTVTAACLAEVRDALRDTTTLSGADYAILPRRRPPRCATRYNGTLTSIGAQRTTTTDTMAPVADRFGADAAVDKTNPNKPATATQAQPAAWMNSVTATQQQHSAVKPATVAGYGHNTLQPQQSHQQGYTPSWSGSGGGQGGGGGGWGSGGWRPPHPSQTHTMHQPGSNVVYHVHRWDTPPPGCCPCGAN